MKSLLLLEIAVFNLQSALIAAAAGANRLELCDNYYEGGTTPSAGTIQLVKTAVSCPVFVMIRPRGGDFLYSQKELMVMEKDLLTAKKLGCDGAVFGFLQADGSINEKTTKRFVEIAYPMEVTFHRAFDCAKDPFEALEKVIECGCQRILTSGRQPTATEGAILIKQLVSQADDRVIIMPGAGVRKQTIEKIARETGASEFHSSAFEMIPSAMINFNTNVKGMTEFVGVNKQEIKEMTAALFAIQNETTS